ncbi:MAG: OmpA family protein [Candidatus Spyradosoma sp.]
MKNVNFALILLAALAVGCTPSRGPTDGANARKAAPLGGQNEIAAVPSDDVASGDQLTDADVRSVDEKAAAWISGNCIPEEAKLCTIYFGFDKFSVDAEARAQLDAIVDKTRGNGIYVVGYSDYFGTTDYNLALSDKRANAVKAYLNKLGGAQSAQIQAMGEQFAVQSGTRDEVAKDRKVIVVDANAAN